MAGIPQTTSDVIENMKVDESIKSSVNKLAIKLKIIGASLAKTEMELQTERTEFEADLKLMEDIGDREVPNHYKMIKNYFERILYDHDQVETAYFEFVTSLSKEEK
jgi:hypothetical protein